MTPTPRLPRPTVLMLALLGIFAAHAQAKCIDEDAPDPVPEVRTPAPLDRADPKAQLKALVGESLKRSQAVGASRLLADAARSDIEEAKAAGKPQITASMQTAYVGSMSQTLPLVDGGQARVGVNAAGPLWDAGRTESLTSWREQLAQAAAAGQLTAEEQVALQTVNLSLERLRYRQQTRVYQQYARKMSCLVEALEQIVASDKGRASELVQAQKSQQQAELQQQQAQSQLLQTEVRLKRFVGEALPQADGVASLLLKVPPLPSVQAQAESAPEITQLAAQAEAQSRYADAVRAGQKPQLSWNVGGSAAAGVGAPRNWSVGMNLNVPLYTPADNATLGSARKRADAARLQWQDALESRRSRAADVHEQATSAYDRAARVVGVLRDSDRVRNYTLQQWRQLGRRSLFDVMSSESDYYQLRVQQVNALTDGQQATALLWSLGRGLVTVVGE